MQSRPFRNRTLQLVVTTVFIFWGRDAASQQAPAARATAPPEIVVATATENAEGVTQDAFNLNMLKDFERRTLLTIRKKMTDYLKSQNDPTPVPGIKSEAHYMQAGLVKLAVVRLKAPGSLNQVFVFGIVGLELRRVVCVRVANIDLAIPIAYGPCGEKIRETYGVNLLPK